MADLNVGSLVVGINDYNHEYYRQDERRLAFAEADALAFHDYVRAAFPNSPKDNHTALFGGSAEASAIRQSLAELATRRPFDLFFFYFAGHGERNADSAWLCAVDAAQGETSLRPDELDGIFSSLEADIALIFLDCCYAEKIVSRSEYLNSLDNSRARLFICSARADQRTWEEKKLGHGIFSYLLITALSKKTTISQSGDYVDVEKDLFPHLCEQVPLAVIKYKSGHRQEPVKGGISRAEVKLPVATTGFGGISSSVYDVVKRRYRQMLAITAATVLLAFLLIQIFFYHLAIDETGRVVVRYGLRETSGFLPSAVGNRVDSGFDTAALSVQKSPENLALLSSLQNGEIWGIWTHNSSKGYRSWIESLGPLLKERHRERTVLLLTGSLGEDMAEYVRKSLSENEAKSWSGVESWRTKLVAESVLLNQTEKSEKGKWLLLQIPIVENVDLNSSSPPTNVVDYSVLNLRSSDMIEHMNALGLYAVAEPNTHAGSLLDVLKIVSYRAFWSKRSDETEKELAALGNLFRSLAQSRKEAGLDSLSTAETALLNSYLDSWCAPGVSVILSSISGVSDQSANLRHLTKALKAIDPARREVVHTYPILSISILAENNQIDATFAGEVFETANRMFPSANMDDRWRRLLARVAFSAPMPATVKEAFLQRLRGNEEDDPTLDAFLILSANYRFLDDAERTVLMAWFEPRIQKLKTFSYTVPGYAYLAKNGVKVQETTSLLDERILADLRIYDTSENLRPGFLNVVSDDSEQVIALAQIAQDSKLPDSIRDRLYLFAVNRPDFAQSREIFRGLAMQRLQFSNDNNQILARSISFSHLPRDYYRKRVEIEIGIHQVLLLSEGERAMTTNEIRRLWEKETEPDLKMYLADIILRTRQ